ncbi:MAG: flavodoxin family protein [Syntrophomonas sp.]
MKKVLGLVISNRKLGNSEILLKEIMRSIPYACQYELIRLTDLRIDPCLACYKCLEHDNECVMKDDFNFVMDRIKRADALIIGVPVYLLGPQGSYKMLCDRLVSCFKYHPFTAGKPCIIVVPFGTQRWEGYTKAAALVMPHLLQMKLVDYWPVHAALPGESLMDKTNLEYARDLGKRLFYSKTCSPGPRECPYCGSDLFRLLPDNKIECPLCGIEGHLEMDAKPSFAPNQECRFTSQNILEHFNGWVKAMKNTFLEEKHELKKIQRGYEDFDWWISP